MYIYTYTCIYIYIYIYGERDKQKDLPVSLLHSLTIITIPGSLLGHPPFPSKDLPGPQHSVIYTLFA